MHPATPVEDEYNYGAVFKWAIHENAAEFFIPDPVRLVNEVANLLPL